MMKKTNYIFLQKLDDIQMKQNKTKDNRKSFVFELKNKQNTEVISLNFLLVT